MANDRKKAVIDSGVFREVISELFPGAVATDENQLLDLCVFHPDKNPSLSINTKHGLFNCFSCGAKGNGFDLYMKIKGCDFKTALEELEKRTGITPAKTYCGRPQVVATFVFRDAEGSPLYWKKRYEPGFDGRSKSFVFYHKSAKGQEVKGRGCQAVPYNLHVLAAHPEGEPVFFLEGEKKADVLTSWDLCATSLDSGGQSGKGAAWRKEFNPYFKGREVYILPDNDKTGEEYAATLAGHLAGIAAAVKILRLPGLPEKGDIIDWCEIEQAKVGR